MKTKHYHILTGIVSVLSAFPVSATVVHSGRSITIVQPLDACGSVQEQNGSISTGTARAVITDTYFDALGHKSLSIVRKGASATKDMVIDYDCDFSGNVSRISRPLPVLSNGTLQEEEIPSTLINYYDDSAPYNSFLYEQTNGHLLLSETQAGSSYQNHPITYVYRANTNNEVALWKVTENGVERAGFYPEGALSVTTKTDSEGASVSLYKDTRGKTIMRLQGEETTYYVYDSFDRLRYILPPAVSGHLTDGIYSSTHELIQLYGYEYRYDRKSQLVMKRLPGCDSIVYEYNSLGQLVYTQDGNQRQRGDYWLKTEYDDRGRKTAVSEVNRSDGSYIKRLQQFYYDDYSALQTLTQFQQNSLAFAYKSGFDNSYASATGLLTMTITYGLTSTTQNIDVFYYDYRGRCIQQQINAMQYSNTICHAYHFDGTETKRLLTHSELDMKEEYNFSYDYLGRQTTTEYGVGEKGDMDDVIQSVKSYDEVGRQYQTSFHNNAITRIDSFDIRGHLTKRTEGVFTERLYYADNLPNYATPYYNGLISANKVSIGNDEELFMYQYDTQNRLVSAHGNSKRLEQFEYDEMGNICYMNRKDEDGNLDVLTYSYSGNQLVEIEDIAGNQNYYNTKEYVDASSVDTTMFYDKNGTIIVDLDRNICAIRNNILNLPDTVQFTNGNQIINHYDAMGRKQSTIYRTLTTPIVVPVGAVVNLPSNNYTTRTVYYSGNLKIDSNANGTLFIFYTPEGYFQTDDLSGYRHHCYYIRDHLGNVCAVWDSHANGYTQTTFYYPSGVPMNISTNQAIQPNKYNGKPYEEMHGMDVYEYESRNYYATIMRFTAMDPLCEQTPWQSPYVYAANNPVCNVDWMGLSPWSFANGSYGTYHMTIIDAYGKVLYHIDDGNMLVYLFDGDNFDENNIDYSTLLLIGFELPGVKYKINKPCLYLGFLEGSGGGGYTHEEPNVNPVIFCGNRPATPSEIRSWIQGSPLAVLISSASNLAQVAEYANKDNSVFKGTRVLGKLFSIGGIIYDADRLLKGQDYVDSIIGIVTNSLSLSGNPYCLLAAMAILSTYEVCLFGKEVGTQFVEWNTYINTNSYNIVGDMYLNGF